MATYTDDEKQTIRTAAFGAMYLVSNAEPGFVDMMKESFAGAQAFGKASPQFKDLLKSGGLPQVPMGAPDQIESNILNALSQSTAILQSKGAPEDLDGFRNAVTNAVDSVAQVAGGGASQAEEAEIQKVKAAIGVG
jgi:hypothetical protein